jgi:hypothetical protein
MLKELRNITEDQAETLWEGDGYAEYIRKNADDSRVICNGDTLLEAMEDEYLFDEYLASLGFQVV